MTGTDIYNLALQIMNENAEYGNISDYEAKAPAFINMIMTEFAMWEYNGRYMSHAEQTPITALTDDVLLPDTIARGVMPYKLASMLLLEEDPTRAAYFDKMYLDRKNQLTRRVQHQIERVV